MKGFFEILIALCIIFAFFYYKLFASAWFWAILVVVVLVMQSELIRHYTFQMLAVVFGAIYLPMNMFLMFITKEITKFKKHDMIVYSIFKLLFFPLQIIVTIFSIPYQWLLDNAH